jgi:hypothetical protein
MAIFHIVKGLPMSKIVFYSILCTVQMNTLLAMNNAQAPDALELLKPPMPAKIIFRNPPQLALEPVTCPIDLSGRTLTQEQIEKVKQLAHHAYHCDNIFNAAIQECLFMDAFSKNVSSYAGLSCEQVTKKFLEEAQCNVAKIKDEIAQCGNRIANVELQEMSDEEELTRIKLLNALHNATQRVITLQMALYLETQSQITKTHNELEKKFKERHAQKNSVEENNNKS